MCLNAWSTGARESGRVIVSSEESFGSSSDDDSILWTEEFIDDMGVC